MTVPEPAGTHTTTARRSVRRRIVEATVSIVVAVAIFMFAIPAISNSDYSQIWEHLSKLSIVHLSVLTAVWIATMSIYTGVLTSSLPGLRHSQALVVNFAGSAVSNVVPFGGAVGVAATYAMCMSWGYPAGAITLSILVSGIWNVLAKFALPVLALVVLVAAHEATTGLVVPAFIGLVVMVGAVALFAGIIRSEQLAVAVGGLAERLLTKLGSSIGRPPSTGIADAIVEFRHTSIGLIRNRWRSLSVWMLLYQFGHFMLLLLCVRLIGSDNNQLSWAAVLAAFAFGNLLTAIPLTPSGVGFVEAGTVAILIAFGGPDAGSAAAVLLYRGFTYLAEIPFGAVGWLAWASIPRWRVQAPPTITEVR